MFGDSDMLGLQRAEGEALIPSLSVTYCHVFPLSIHMRRLPKVGSSHKSQDSRQSAEYDSIREFHRHERSLRTVSSLDRVFESNGSSWTGFCHSLENDSLG